MSEKLLPADALLANRKALATLKEFSTSLSSSPSGYPPAAVKNVEFVFRWGPCVCVCSRFSSPWQELARMLHAMLYRIMSLCCLLLLPAATNQPGPCPPLPPYPSAGTPSRAAACSGCAASSRRRAATARSWCSRAWASCCSGWASTPSSTLMASSSSRGRRRGPGWCASPPRPQGQVHLCVGGVGAGSDRQAPRLP